MQWDTLYSSKIVTEPHRYFEKQKKLQNVIPGWWTHCAQLHNEHWNHQYFMDRCMRSPPSCSTTRISIRLWVHRKNHPIYVSGSNYVFYAISLQNAPREHHQNGERTLLPWPVCCNFRGKLNWFDIRNKVIYYLWFGSEIFPR